MGNHGHPYIHSTTILCDILSTYMYETTNPLVTVDRASIGMASKVQHEKFLLFTCIHADKLLVECYALLASGECPQKIRSTYNVMVCAVPVT